MSKELKPCPTIKENSKVASKAVADAEAWVSDKLTHPPTKEDIKAAEILITALIKQLAGVEAERDELKLTEKGYVQEIGDLVSKIQELKNA